MLQALANITDQITTLSTDVTQFMDEVKKEIGELKQAVDSLEHRLDTSDERIALLASDLSLLQGRPFIKERKTLVRYASTHDISSCTDSSQPGQRLGESSEWSLDYLPSSRTDTEQHGSAQ